jgi:hypothetical protein
MKYRFKYEGGWIVTLLVILLILTAIALGPVAVIWSLNTLFPMLAIPFNIYTWLATAILLIFVIPTVSTK